MTTCAAATCDRPVKTRGWCQAHYMRLWYTGDVDESRPLALKTRTPDERFDQFLRPAPNECIHWQGSVGRLGYGSFSVNGRRVPAHRYAYERACGPIPDGRQLDHVCHTRDESCKGGASCLHRRCVNPAHLEPVTPVENTRRGRSADWNRSQRERKPTCSQGHLFTPDNIWRDARGYRQCRECNRLHARARSLKSQGLRDPRRTADDKVEQIVTLLRAGMPATKIAPSVGVSYRTVMRVKHGEGWFTL